MPRNGSGTMVISNIFVPNTDILSSEVNDNFDDIADEISNSFPRDGQAAMTGVAKFIAGTALLPGISFGTDPDTGVYLAGPNQLGFAQGGVGVLLDALFPAGIVKAYAGSTAPTMHLLCYGQAVSRTTYAKLFAAIGTAFGIGDGTNTFNVPDLRGRIIAGLDNMGGVAANRLVAPFFDATALGNAGGAQSHTLDIGQMPWHGHGVNDPGHGHGVSDPGHGHLVQRLVSISGGGAGYSGGTPTDVFTSSAFTGIGIYGNFTGISIQANGGSGAHNNIQPTMALNYIITTGF